MDYLAQLHSLGQRHAFIFFDPKYLSLLVKLMLLYFVAVKDLDLIV